MERVKLAIQKDGRMTQGSLQLLERAGLSVEFQSRVLVSQCTRFPMDILSVRDDDIPEYVATGVSELGIVGENILSESGCNDVVILERLGFARCRLAIAVPRALGFSRLDELGGKRIATTYPKTLKRFLDDRGLEAEVIELSGAVEIAPSLGMADAICDLVSTGATAKLNGLEFLCPILESEAVLIANRDAIGDRAKKPAIRETIENLLLRIRSTERARKLKYVMMNAPQSSVAVIREFIPGMKSPSIVPLLNPELVAIHAVVPEDILWDVISRLKDVGATDIVALTVDSLIP